MVRSMTGYGRFELLKNDVNYIVEIKSVNHRYFEFSARTPKGCVFLEEKLKAFMSESDSKISSCRQYSDHRTKSRRR